MTPSRLVLITVLTLLVATPLLCSSNFKVDTFSRHITDQTGAARVFHGANVAFKPYPYLPSSDPSDPANSFTSNDAKFLKSIGHNVIRLTIYWEGVEPVRGQYNEAYVNRIKEIMDVCEEYGIKVLVDLHQDAVSRKYCGEGMPDWAV